jgi:hypothetical protein
VAPTGDENPDRGSTTGAASWTDREPASGLPRGRAKRVNPPSPPYFKKSSYASTGFFSHVAPTGGMRTPTGVRQLASQLDRPRACERAAPQGRAKRVNPPSPPYFKKSSYASTGFFHMWHPPGDENPRPGFDNWRSHRTERKTNRMKLSHFTSLGFVKQK